MRPVHYLLIFTLFLLILAVRQQMLRRSNRMPSGARVYRCGQYFVSMQDALNHICADTNAANNVELLVSGSIDLFSVTWPETLRPTRVLIATAPGTPRATLYVASMYMMRNMPNSVTKLELNNLDLILYPSDLWSLIFFNMHVRIVGCTIYKYVERSPTVVPFGIFIIYNSRIEIISTSLKHLATPLFCAFDNSSTIYLIDTILPPNISGTSLATTLNKQVYPTHILTMNFSMNDYGLGILKQFNKNFMSIND